MAEPKSRKTRCTKGTNMHSTPSSAVALCCAVALVSGLAAEAAAAEGPGPYRDLAPGVMITIPPEMQPGEAFGVHNVVELLATPDLAWTPHYLPTVRTLSQKATDAFFRRRIWCLQFSFKPVRTIYVDVPQPSGKMQRKLVWYLIYEVKNLGNDLVPRQKPDGRYQVTRAPAAVRFVPHFVLESHEYDKSYLDRVIPAAIGPIQQREDPRRQLLTSVEMAQRMIEPSTDRRDRSVWGVATWLDVDPRIDFFSVFVQGLTNAYRWEDPAEAYTFGDPPGTGRRFAYKTLQLNFWRPGDTLQQHEDEIRFGTPADKHPMYGVREGVDYAWVYR